MNRWMRVCGWMWKVTFMAALLLVSGCKSTDQPASAGFASVILHGNTPGQIAQVAIQVFEDHGYKTASSVSQRLVFEKEGSTMSNISYGNWLESSVWERVRAAVEPVSEGTFRLKCQAYVVRDRNGTTEEEIKVMRRGKYKKLLEEVAQRLSAPPQPQS